MDGCLGVPFLLLKQDRMYPMGEERLSFPSDIDGALQDLAGFVKSLLVLDVRTFFKGDASDTDDALSDFASVLSCLVLDEVQCLKVVDGSLEERTEDELIFLCVDIMAQNSVDSWNVFLKTALITKSVVILLNYKRKI